MKIKYFASGFFLFARNFSRGIQKSYLEHRAGIRKIRKMKGKKIWTKIKEIPLYPLLTLDPATILGIQKNCEIFSRDIFSQKLIFEISRNFLKYF